MKECKVKILAGGVVHSDLMDEDGNPMITEYLMRPVVLCLTVMNNDKSMSAIEAVMTVGPSLIEVDGEKMLGLFFGYVEWSGLKEMMNQMGIRTGQRLMSGYYESDKMRARGEIL